MGLLNTEDLYKMSDYDFFEVLEAVTKHPVDQETKDIMKDEYSIKGKTKLIKGLEKIIKKLKTK